MTPFAALLGFSAFALSYLSLGAFRLWAERGRILDVPNERSAHVWPVARGGGLVIVAAVLPGVWLAARHMGAAERVPALLAYTLGALLIANVSWLDDLKPLPVWVRLGAQCAGALAAVVGIGYWHRISLPFVGDITLGLWGAVLAFLWIVCFTNAFNFMDGIDGIAGLQAVVAAAAWTVAAYTQGQPLAGILALLTGCGTLGFLGHNWPPARIFMGDVGSAFLGYTFAVLPLLLGVWAGPEAGGGALLLGLLFIWPFAFDTLYTLLRRLMERKNVLQAHQEHLYQRLVAAGRSPRTVTWLYGGLALTGAVLGEPWSGVSPGGHLTGSVAVPLLCLGLLRFVRDTEKQGRALKPSARVHMLRYRRFLIVLSQAALLAVTYCFSFLLRLDFSLVDPYLTVFLHTLPLALAVKLLVFAYFQLFRGWWRYVGTSDLLDIIKAALVSTPLLFAGVHLIYGFDYYPRSVFVIDPILTVLAIGGVRFAVRINTEHARRYLSHSAAIIVGAGEEGGAVARELRSNPKLDYYPIGFVDDDPTKRGVRIQGIKVLGSTEDLPRIIAENEVSQVLIAVPSPRGRQIHRLIELCRQCKVDFKILPAMGDLIGGGQPAAELRGVKVEDLLARQPVRLDTARIRARFQGKPVLVTGGAGSIGSELARQLAALAPARLVLLDRAESALHQITLELAELAPGLACTPVLGDILDVPRLRDLFAEHRPQSVFHAAAYKHVPMMEQNIFQAVANNIFGTYNVALVARQSGAEDLVLISSDKAVNPTSVMGATKRVAELLILGLQHQSTRFTSVRFGNVLGSQGSVLPLFEQQIAQRRPVTVTDPAAQRYFMTISEAAHLVLQASALGKGGEIFILDMGEPVKVLDLARDLIRLSGLEPDRDIPIVFTGLRPGEKLVEELRLDGEGIRPTAHEKIRVLDGGEVAFDQVRAWLEDLSTLVNSKNTHGLITRLKQIVPEYVPSREVLTQSEVDRYDRSYSYNPDPAGNMGRRGHA